MVYHHNIPNMITQKVSVFTGLMYLIDKSFDTVPSSKRTSHVDTLIAISDVHTFIYAYVLGRSFSHDSFVV